MTEFIYRPKDQHQYEQARLDCIIKEALEKVGCNRQSLRMVVRRLTRLGYNDDSSQARLAFHMSQLQRGTGGVGKRRPSDLSRVRAAFEAERKRQGSRSSSPTTPRG